MNIRFEVYPLHSLTQAFAVKQLTGCRATALRRLAAAIAPAFKTTGRGRPLRHDAFTAVCITLVKWRNNLSLRAIEALTGIDATTASRYVIRVSNALCEMALAGTSPQSTLIVDSTSARVASTEPRAYSGYKHHRCSKVQVVTRKDGRIVDVSQSYPGAVHGPSRVNEVRINPMLNFEQILWNSLCTLNFPDLSTPRPRPPHLVRHPW